MATLGDVFKQKFAKISKDVQEHSKNVNTVPVVGVVVPANGTHVPCHDHSNRLDPDKLRIVGPPPRVAPPTPALDESQLVGELLHWLNDKGYLWRMEGRVRTAADTLTPTERDDLQRAFFAFQARRAEEL